MARNPIVGGIGFALDVDDTKFIQQLRKAGERGKRELLGTTTEADRLEDQLRQTGATGERAMRQVGDQTDRVADQMQRARRSADALRNTVSGLALGAAFVAGTKTIAEFSQSMSTLQAVSGATGGELESLRNKALELGASTRFSATQAADAMGELARAGFTANEVLAAIGPTLSAAQAGGVEIATAAEIIGTTIRGFGLEAGEAARVADVLAQAANASNAGITDLGEALKFAAPTAQQLGLDLEETIAIIGKLSDGGLKGGLAGRGFQSLATQIVNNRDEITGLIGDFDIAEDGLAGIIRRLKEAGITTEQVIKLFRAENLDTFGILANAAIDGSLDRLDEVLRAAEGSSARAAKIMDDNLNGAILGAQSRLEALIIALGDAGAADGLVKALEGLSGLLKIAAENADVLQVAIIALAVRALLPMAVAIGGKVIASVVALQAQLVILTAIAGRSTTALATSAAVAGRLAFALGPVTLGLAAAAAAYVALARDAESTDRALSKASDSFGKYAAQLDTVKSDTADLEAANERLRQAIDEQGPAARRAADIEIAAIQDRLAANQQLAELYATQALNDLNRARAALPEERERVSRALGFRGVIDFTPRLDEAEYERQIDAFLERIKAKTARGLTLSPDEQKDLSIIQGYREAQAELTRLEEQQKAFNDARRAEERDYATSRDFAGQGGNPFQKDIDAEFAKIKRLEDTIREAERSGSEAAKRVAADYQNQIEASRRYIEELQRGIAPELARQIADAGRDQTAISEQLAVIDQLNADITFAQAQGRTDIVNKRREELKIAEDTLALLQAGANSALATELAAPPKATKAAADPILEDARRKAAAVGDEFTKMMDSPIEALNRWRDESIKAINLVAKSEEDRARLRAQLDAVYAERYDEIFIKEQETVLGAVNAENAKQQAIEDTLAARDLEIELQLAQLRGDEEAVKALEAKADRQQRINELVSEGLALTEATARADEEIRRLKAGQLSDADAAKQAFVEGLSSDVSGALLNAVRSGDYGNIFQEVINSAAARGLEDAISALVDEFTNFLGNAIFGSNGQGGLLSGFFGGGAEAAGELAADAVTGAADVAGDASEAAASAAATAALTALGAAGTAAATAGTAAAGADTAQAAAASSAAAALAAVVVAAQAAASALAATAAASGTSSAVTVASFGGGRARGGPVVPGKFYEVNEGGLPELLSVGQRKFLLPGSEGQVTPLAGSTLPQASSRETARFDIYVHGTGNEEIERAVSRGMQQAVKIARAQAGPAAAEFQTRKV